MQNSHLQWRIPFPSSAFWKPCLIPEQRHMMVQSSTTVPFFAKISAVPFWSAKRKRRIGPKNRWCYGINITQMLLDSYNSCILRCARGRRGKREKRYRLTIDRGKMVGAKLSVFHRDRAHAFPRLVEVVNDTGVDSRGVDYVRGNM